MKVSLWVGSEDGEWVTRSEASLAALRADPDDPTARVLAANLARTIRQRGDPGGALTLTAEVSELAPGDVLSEIEAAAALQEIGLVDQARDTLERARAIDDDAVRQRAQEDPAIAGIGRS